MCDYWCWKINFRMSKECFRELADELHFFLALNADSPNPRKTKSLRMSKLTFQRGLKFRFDYMRFFFRFSDPFGWAENPCPVFHTGLGFSARFLVPLGTTRRVRVKTIAMHS